MIPSEIIEFAVWVHLDELEDPELILLKGHLLLEIVIDNALNSYLMRGNHDSLGLSFYRKLELLNLLHTGVETEFVKVRDLLTQLNRLRNRLAHQHKFENGHQDIGDWSNLVLREFQNTKFTKYTFRTKIVHAFACLSRAIHEFTNKRPNP